MAASPERARRARKPSVKAALNDGLQQLVRMQQYRRHIITTARLQLSFSRAVNASPGGWAAVSVTLLHAVPLRPLELSVSGQTRLTDTGLLFIQGDAATEENTLHLWNQEQASSFLAAFHQHGTKNWQKVDCFRVATPSHVSPPCISGIIHESATCEGGVVHPFAQD
jgi:hypothetical protein